MRARSASPPVARWPVHHDRDDKSPAARQTMPVAGVVQRPVTEQLDLNLPPQRCAIAWPFSTVASGAAR